MTKKTETKAAANAEQSTLEAATNVLVRMEGMGKANARRFLKRCTADEVAKIAGCKIGDQFRSMYGEIVDAILKRQEVKDS